jgi:hypothetical protein
VAVVVFFLVAATSVLGPEGAWKAVGFALLFGGLLGGGLRSNVRFYADRGVVPTPRRREPVTPSKVGDPNPVDEHARCTRHRKVVLEAEAIGCFYCLQLSRPEDVREWVDPDLDGVGQTALCPRCGIDSVIPVRPGVDHEFLRRMHARWF